jgi:protein-tyrosine phosphatase
MEYRSPGMASERVSLCFVCLGNICRSPTAAGVMRHLVAEAGLTDRIFVESAGTSAYHLGEPPDRRSSLAARRRGVDIGNRGKQFTRRDFERFDYVLAMDESNLSELERLSTGSNVGEKLRLLRSFDPAAGERASVPDPYYGGEDGFDEVLDMCFAACVPLLTSIRLTRGW